MSDTLLRRLQFIQRETRRLHFAAQRIAADSARYPADYFRPAELMAMRGVRR